MKVKYRRGLFRLWMVFTIAWVGYFSWLGVTSYRDVASSWKSVQRLGEEARELRTKAQAIDTNSTLGRTEYQRLQADNERIDDLIEIDMKRIRNHQADFEIAYIYGPTVPLLLLLLFPIGSFVIREFAPERSQNADSASELGGKTAQMDANVVCGTGKQEPSSEVSIPISGNSLATGVYCAACGKNTAHDGQYCSICGRSKAMAEKFASANKNERRDNVRRIWMTAGGFVLLVIALATLYSLSPADSSRASRRVWDAFVGTSGVLLILAALGYVLYLVVIGLRRIYRYFGDKRAKT